MIRDVVTKQLKVIPDDRGRVMEMLRRDDVFFEEFGQVYLSTTYPGVVKAWHYHKLQSDYFVCVKGMVKLVLADTRDGSPTKGQVDEFVIGEHNPLLVKVPPGVYHGWKCIGREESYVINVPTEPYDRANPDEYRLDPHQNGVIDYDWRTRDR